MTRPRGSRRRCALRVTDSAGDYYAPFGHAAEFPTGRGEAVGGDVVWTEALGVHRRGLRDRPAAGRINRRGDEGTGIFGAPRNAQSAARKDGPAVRGPARDRPSVARVVFRRHTAHFISPHAALLEAAAEDLAIVQS